jgi:sulfur carrier protein
MTRTVPANRVFVNDRPMDFAEGAVLAVLLRELGLAERKGVAVAVNGSVVARRAWSARRLEPEDRILVIQATQGG